MYVKKGMKAKILKFDATEKSGYGVTSSMRRMIGNVYTVDQVSKSGRDDGSLCVRLGGWNWSNQDLIPPIDLSKQKKEKPTTFNPENLVI